MSTQEEIEALYGHKVSMVPIYGDVTYAEPYCIRVALEILEKYRSDDTMREIVNESINVLLQYLKDVQKNPQPLTVSFKKGDK